MLRRSHAALLVDVGGPIALLRRDGLTVTPVSLPAFRPGQAARFADIP
ncbi:hypothetical protein JUN65_00010 [Gluconacetobacter azotocaptans]|nr:hypothetical protein [Gluconacetobacter azotocaptans]MBM9399985.1 hypothetical protein [Gluconacetobacter azotocaptans]